jgi:hypothetical protein
MLLSSPLNQSAPHPRQPGKLCIEVSPGSKIAWISEELCIGCGICVKVRRRYVSAAACMWEGLVRRAAAAVAARERAARSLAGGAGGDATRTRRSQGTHRNLHVALCPKQKCPFEAIMIINLPKNLEGHTTHRYGPNSFKLHRCARRAGGGGGCGGGEGLGAAAAGGRRF